MIISTGIAEIDDIELAIETCKKSGNNDITILKCNFSVSGRSGRFQFDDYSRYQKAIWGKSRIV